MVRWDRWDPGDVLVRWDPREPGDILVRRDLLVRGASGDLGDSLASRD